MNNSIFHYTDINALFSILTSRTVRLTDIRFLNDKEEFYDGSLQLSLALSNIQYNPFAKQKNKAKNILENYINDMRKYGINEQSVFTCSFSKKEDLLSQWRSYGMFSIEFDREQLNKIGLNIQDCVYEHEDKWNLSEKVCKEIIDSLSRIVQDDNEELVNTHLEQALLNSALFKNEGFIEEAEARAFITMSLFDEKIKFRTRNNLIIPYVDIPFNPLCVKAVHVGPVTDSKHIMRSIKTFIKNLEEKWAKELYPNNETDYSLLIKESFIPYRS